MTKKNMGRDRWHGATLQTTDRTNATRIHSGIKAGIVRLAVCGLLPATFAAWLIQRGGMKDA